MVGPAEVACAVVCVCPTKVGGAVVGVCVACVTAGLGTFCPGAGGTPPPAEGRPSCPLVGPAEVASPVVCPGFVKGLLVGPAEVGCPVVCVCPPKGGGAVVGVCVACVTAGLGKFCPGAGGTPPPAEGRPSCLGLLKTGRPSILPS